MLKVKMTRRMLMVVVAVLNMGKMETNESRAAVIFHADNVAVSGS
jgi:hypothetical protein